MDINTNMNKDVVGPKMEGQPGQGLEGGRLTVIDNEFYTACCYPTKGLIHHQWHKYCVGENLRNALTKAVEAFMMHHCTKWLSDDRKFGGVLHPDDWKWGETHFTDRAIEAGWKYSATVLPEKAIAKLSTSALIQYFAARGVETRFFTRLLDAQQWIYKQ